MMKCKISILFCVFVMVFCQSVFAYDLPYQDDVGTTALWHMDSVRSLKYVDDDDSAVPGRNADIILSPNPIDTAGGPTLTDPSVTAGLGYPAGSFAFGKCMFFDGVDDFAVIVNGSLSSLDPCDLSIEGWFKQSVDANDQIIFDRWGQIVLYVRTDEFKILTWDSTSTTDWHHITQTGWDSTAWNHFAVKITGETMKVYLNGSLESTGTLSGGLSQTTSKTNTYLAQRYSGSNKFAGYLDEIRISKASIPGTPAGNTNYKGVQQDEFYSVKALWHFDSSVLDGVVKFPDDDAANGGRNADLTALNDYVASTTIGIGPEIVNPVTEGIGYPDGDSNMASVAKFVADQNDGTNATNIVIAEPNNLYVGGWFKISDAMADASADAYDFMVLFDRWSQVVIRLIDDGNDWELQMITWDANETPNVVITDIGSESSLGLSFNDWQHVAVEVIGNQVNGYINGTKTVNITLPVDGLKSLDAGKTTWLGCRYASYGYYFDGYMDEWIIKQAVPYLPGDLTGYLKPYEDESPTTKALWHFDEYMDPCVTGDIYTPDDDANSLGRDVDFELWHGSPGVQVAAINDPGPLLVTPPNYPAGDPNFGKAAFLDNWNTDAEYFRVPNTLINVDPNNMRIEGWLMLDPDFTPAADNSANYVFDRWGQVVIRVLDSTADGLILQVIWFSNDGANYTRSIYYDDIELDPKTWHHVAVEVKDNLAKIMVNGIVRDSVTFGANGLKSPVKPWTYLGSRYNATYLYKFPGYLDEWRITSGGGQCGTLGYFDADLNEDCYVDLLDLDLQAIDWLTDTVSGVDYGVQDDYQDFNVPMTTSAPTIDGTLAAGEWDDAKIVTLIYPDLVTAPQVGTQKYEEPTPEDFSGYFYYKWDATYLYVGFKVLDDSFIAPDSLGGYPDDHVLFGFDPDVGNTVSDDTLTFEMFRDDTGTTQTNIYWNKGGTLLLTNSVFASAVDGSNWSYEAALKWNEITGNAGYTPIAGDQYSSAVLMCDQDDTQGSDRETFLYDAGSGDTAAMVTPSLWHDVTLSSSLACGDNGYRQGDVNRNCKIDLFDYAILANDWMKCSDPEGSGCVSAN